jgi:hypothetical protein
VEKNVKHAIILVSGKNLYIIMFIKEYVLMETQLNRRKKMNKATIIRDSDGEVYLCVDGKPLDEPAYFKIQAYATEPNNDREILSNVFEIDLTGEE